MLLIKKNGPSEEAEEGEVDDGSEPEEEADSDPPSPNDVSKQGRSSKSGNAAAGSLKTRSTSGSKADIRNGAQLVGVPSLERLAPNSTYTGPNRTVYSSVGSGPAQAMLDASSSPNHCSFPQTGNSLTVGNAPGPNITHFGVPPGPQIPNPNNSAPVQQAPLPFPAPGPNAVANSANVRLPGWPLTTTPAVTPPGSLQEIEQMHQMYQKACELYEKAMEKINASGVKLPMGMLPRPPAPFVPLNVTIVPAATNTTNQHHSPAPLSNSLTSGLLPPPPPPPSLPTQQPSPTPSTLSSHSAYQTAYSLAYQQTMKAIPAPQDGGPTPNTPEFGATWQRYMDHYLRYYLRSSGITLPDQQQAPSSTPTTTVTTGTGSSSSKDAEIAAAMMPTNPADIELPPSPKRSRSTDTNAATTTTTQDAVRTKNDENTSTGRSEVEQKPSTTTTTAQSIDQSSKTVDVGNHESKAQKPSLVDDTNASKYVWMSNLPQGVKAVDIKDRCTPFGRVQTIKIIGSRKSKPPSIYAYLIMETPDAAGRLIDGLQGAKFGNNEIKLKRINALPIP